jgi:hypothetical protein
MTPVREESYWQNTPQVKQHQVDARGKHEPPEGAAGRLSLLRGAGTDYQSMRATPDGAGRAGAGAHVPDTVCGRILVFTSTEPSAHDCVRAVAWRHTSRVRRRAAMLGIVYPLSHKEELCQPYAV